MFSIARTTSLSLVVLFTLLTPIYVDAFFGFSEKRVYIDEYRSSWNPGHARYDITIHDSGSMYRNSRASVIMAEAFAFATPSQGESVIAKIMRAQAAQKQSNKIQAETAKILAETELLRAMAKQLKADNAATSQRVVEKRRKPTPAKQRKHTIKYGSKQVKINCDKWLKRIERLPKASQSRLDRMILNANIANMSGDTRKAKRLMKQFERAFYAEVDKVVARMPKTKPIKVDTSYLFAGLLDD